MKQVRGKSVLIVGAIGAVSLIFGGVAVAQDTPSTQVGGKVEQRLQETRQKAEDAKAQAQARADEAKARAQAKAEETKARTQAKTEESKQRLEGKKLEQCQAREQRIDATMTQMTSRGEKHYDVFTKIADRVKTFVDTKKLTVENYDALVAEVDAKAAAAQAAIQSTKSVGDVFSCDSDNPKIASTAFRDAFKAQVAALKDYRTAIKNLIVAVKSSQPVTGAAEGSTNE